MNNKSSVILSIDTTDSSTLTISVNVNTVEYTVKEDVGTHRLSRLLPLCTELLSAHNCTWFDVTSIYIVNHEGSLTMLRVGFAVANSLGFLLGVPVNGLPAMKNVYPKYGHSTYLDKPLKE